MSALKKVALASVLVITLAACGSAASDSGSGGGALPPPDSAQVDPQLAKAQVIWADMSASDRDDICYLYNSLTQDEFLELSARLAVEEGATPEEAAAVVAVIITECS